MCSRRKNVSILVKSLPYQRDFDRAIKETDESAEQWLLRVKELAKSCGFGKCYDLFVLHKFLAGLETEIIDHLCSSAESVDIDSSLEIIEAYWTQKTELAPNKALDGHADAQNEREVVFSQILIKCPNSPENTNKSDSDDELNTGNNEDTNSDTEQNNKDDTEFETVPKTKRRYKKRAVKEKQTYECETCHYKCAHQCHLRRHKLIHLNEKAYVCDICGKRFNLFINLNAHIRRHIGIKPFACEFCDSSFMDRTRLKLHMRSHTGERPFPCTVCEKKFADAYYLKVHMRLHTGERPFQCSQCDRSFSQSSSLSLHKRKHCFSGQKKERNCK